MNNTEVKEIFNEFFENRLITELKKHYNFHPNINLDFFIFYNYSKKEFKFIPVDEIKSYSRQIVENLLKNKDSFLVFASRDDMTPGTFKNYRALSDMAQKVIKNDVFDICCQNYEILTNYKIKNKEKLIM